MAIAFITDRTQFPSDADPKADAVGWDRFGDRQPVDFAGRPTFQSVTDKLGNPYEIAIRSNHLAGRRQDGGPSWAGSFDAGDALLFTDFSPGPLQFAFVQPLRGAGAQINIKDPVEHVSVGISALDGNNNHVGGGTAMASFNNNGDGSAQFLGVLDEPAGVRRITRIVFFVTVLDHGYRGDSSFAINKLRLAM